MKGPTICRLPCGSARRPTSNPAPRSRVRGTMTRSSASHDLASPSTGSLEGCQLMGDSFGFAGIILHPPPPPRERSGEFAASLALGTMTALCTYSENTGRKQMIPPLKPGAMLLEVDGPVIETARLILRPWRSDDIAANTAMLSDPGTARFITPDGKPVPSA